MEASSYSHIDSTNSASLDFEAEFLVIRLMSLIYAFWLGDWLPPSQKGQKKVDQSILFIHLLTTIFIIKMTTFQMCQRSNIQSKI